MISIAYSSCGTVEFDSMTGKVIQVYRDVKNSDLTEESIHDIDCFDVREYAEWSGRTIPESVDIIEIGYWTKSGEYIEAERSYCERL